MTDFTQLPTPFLKGKGEHIELENADQGFLGTRMQ